MRIGLFSDTYLPDVNGVVSSVELLRKKLSEEGHEVYVICTHPGLIKVEKEGNIIRLPGIEFKKLYGYAIASPVHYFLIDDIEKLNLDIIHVHTEFGVGIFAQMCADKLHIPLVRTYHTTYEDYTHYVNFLGLDSIDKAAKKIIANLSKMFGNNCMRLISPSAKTKEMLLRYGIKTPIEIIPTGTELALFNNDNTSLERKLAIRQECGIKDDEKLMLYVGRIAQEKSLDLVIRSFKKVKEKGLKVKLAVIGGGPDLENLEKMAKDEGVDDLIYFGNKRPFKEVPDYYHSADAFISASTTETQGMTYVEAMSSGLVIFARRDECLEELLFEDETGFYFDDEDELVAKIEKFLALDKDTYLKMSARSKEITKVYDADLFAEKILKLYKEAISEYHRYYLITKTKLKDDHVVLELENSYHQSEKLIVSLDDFYENGLRKNDKIKISLFDTLKDKEEEVIAYKAALNKLALKDHTIKQMYDYLTKKFEDLSIEKINKIIDRLIERGLLDDAKYANNHIEGFEAKLLSSRHMINMLRKDGVSPDIIKETVLEDDDKEFKKASKLALKYQGSIHNKSFKMKKQMILKKLMNEGYTYDIAMKAIDTLDFSNDIISESEVIRKEAKKTKSRYERTLNGTDLRNRVYHTLASKGFSSENIYAILSEMEWDDE